jgi:hypothetical protein
MDIEIHVLANWMRCDPPKLSQRITNGSVVIIRLASEQECKAPQ